MTEIAYAWEAGKVTCEDRDGLTNVVIAVAWTVIATRDDQVAQAGGVTGLFAPDPGSFVAAPDGLTAELVMGWALDAMGAEGVAFFQDQLAVSLEGAPATAAVEFYFDPA